MKSLQIFLAKYTKLIIPNEILIKRSVRTNNTDCKQNGQISGFDKLSIEKLDLKDKRVLIR